MSARQKTQEALQRHVQAMERTGAEQRLKMAGEDADVSVAAPARTKVALDEEGSPLKRQIPSDYDFNPKSLKPLAQTLWAMSVALGHAMTAHRKFTKIKSSTISPDGLIGGRGYVLPVKDIRKALYDACESLSSISDSLHDEINAPHWKPQLASLEEKDLESVERLVGEAEQMMDDPEGEIKDDMEEAEDEGDRADLDAEEESEASEMPDGKGLADTTEVAEKHVKQASSPLTMAERVAARVADSSVAPETLPGPRVETLDRSNIDPDAWEGNSGYTYQSEWSNELERPTAPTTADSGLPTDNAPTSVDDFGLGWDDEEGEDHGVADPHALMPQADSELPQDVMPPVARSDYYPDNNTIWASSEVPTPVMLEYDHDIDLPGTSERHEQNQPYIKWEPDTHNMKPDPIYQRDVQGPPFEGEN